jgi:hypothetical protein
MNDLSDTVDGQPRPGTFLCHLPASSDEARGALAFAPGRRVPVAQHVGAAVQREKGARVRAGKGSQSQTSGVQCGGGSDMLAMFLIMRGGRANRTRDAGHPQPGFSLGGQEDVPAHRHERPTCGCQMRMLG